MPLLEYKQGETFLHRMHPISKFVWGAVVFAWLFVMFNPVHVLAVDLAVIMVAWIGAKIRPDKLVLMAAKIGVAGLFILLLQGTLYPGETILFEIGPISVSQEGLMVGLAIALRIFGIVASSVIISKTTDPTDIYLSLVRIGVPYKIAYALFSALRFLPYMEYEAAIIKDAQKVRGITMRNGGVMAQIKYLANLMVPLIASGLRRAEQSAISAEVRAFGLHETRTHLQTMTATSRSVVFLACWMVSFIAYLALFKLNAMDAVFFFKLS